MHLKYFSLCIAAVLAVFLWPSQVKAIPAFARQIGARCSTCHFQHYPVLNKFGRAFKSSGYSMIGGTTEMVEGDNNLSIPKTLNGALIAALTYQKTNGTNAVPSTSNTSNDGLLSIPQQIHLYLGGRISQNVGSLRNLALKRHARMPMGPSQELRFRFFLM